jgi:hypothetical protein
MFEVDPSIGANAAASRNAFAAASNARLANHFEGLYQRWMAHAEKLERQLSDAQARIAELELALAVEKAHAGGMKAYRDDLRAAHPSSPRLAPSGQRFRKSGNPKPLAALAYDREFDRILRDARISNPEQYRD